MRTRSHSLCLCRSGVVAVHSLSNRLKSAGRVITCVLQCVGTAAGSGIHAAICNTFVRLLVVHPVSAVSRTSVAEWRSCFCAAVRGKDPAPQRPADVAEQPNWRVGLLAKTSTIAVAVFRIQMTL